jgi:dynein heavy chain
MRNLDKHTAEWDDGLVPLVFRKMVSSQNSAEWLVFDGPVSTLWIESLNTVLDDNKKLCLMSGEIIKMSNSMTMIFETDALDNASPATVSRCGMVYLSPSEVGWQSILQTFFLHRFPAKYQCNVGDMQFLKLLVPSVVTVALVSKIPDLEKLDPDAVRLQLYASFLNMWEAFIRSFIREDRSDKKTKDEMAEVLENAAFFALIYSIGGVLNYESQIKFSTRFRSSLPHKFQDSIPHEGSVFDYCYDVASMSWERWEGVLSRTSEADVPTSTVLSNQLFVPTVDTVRASYIVRFLLEAQRHVLLSGETGTGKSVLLSKILRQWKSRASFGQEDSEEDVDADNRDLIKFGFSFSSSPSQVKDNIERGLVIVGRDITSDAPGIKTFKAVFQAPKGTKRSEIQDLDAPSASCVVCIDDINLPAKEEGAQPSVEVIREWMDHSKWYICTPQEMISVTTSGILFVGAMGHPGGGRSQISQRVSRHFQMLTVHLDEISQTRIFTTLMQSHFKGHPTSIAFVPLLVDCSVKLYAALVQNLRPTPLKSHYTFNLRDLCSVFRGIFSVPSENIDATIEGVTNLARLWSHETVRVFHDRLVDEPDRVLFFELLQLTTQSCCCKESPPIESENGTDTAPPECPFPCSPRRLTDQTILANFFAGPECRKSELASVIWGRFPLDGARDPDYAFIGSHRYNQLLDLLRGTESSVESELTHGALILHHYAVSHIARISRVLSQERGNALLIGMGGNGRRSLAKLSARVAGQSLFQIKNEGNYGLAEWQDDLKHALKIAGESETSNLMFLIDGSSIEHDFILEDLSALLNGNFDFFDYEEKSIINEKILAEMEELTKADGALDSRRKQQLQSINYSLLTCGTAQASTSPFPPIRD